MAITGRKFPKITVPAMSYKGETIQVNVVEKAVQENKKILLFWYPKDFTFVCPTELHAFQNALAEFEKRNTIVIGASCDTAEVHFAWLNTPKSQGGIQGITYDILADSNRNLSSALDILDGEVVDYDEELDLDIFSGDNVPYRATYLIDEEGTVFHEGVNHMPLGRNVEDFLRIIDAYSHIQKHGEVCPANWREGKEAMNPNAQSTANYLSKN